MVRRIALLLLLCLASVPAPLAASVAEAAAGDAERADFSGRWAPDFEGWRGVERLLDLQDAPWIVRRAMGRVSVVEEITQTREALVVEMDAPLPLPGRLQRCPFDDRLRDGQTPLGRPSRSRHYWEGAHTLVHVYEMRDPDGAPYTVTARRRLAEDGDAMQLEIVARVPGEPDHRAHQLYRRLPDR